MKTAKVIAGYVSQKKWLTGTVAFAILAVVVALSLTQVWADSTTGNAAGTGKYWQSKLDYSVSETSGTKATVNAYLYVHLLKDIPKSVSNGQKWNRKHDGGDVVNGTTTISWIADDSSNTMTTFNPTSLSAGTEIPLTMSENNVEYDRECNAYNVSLSASNSHTGSGDSAALAGTSTIDAFDVSIPALAKYQIKYNANGGSGAPATNAIKTCAGCTSKTHGKSHGKTCYLSETKPTRTGYTFSGWNTKSDGSGTNYAAGGAYTGNAALTLYAKWTANDLTFNGSVIKKAFSSSNQTATFTGASNGTGTYTYSEVSEKNAGGTATSYISVSGTTITLAANTPGGTYTYIVRATDSNSGKTKDATFTITVARVALSATSGTVAYPNTKSFTVSTNSSGGVLSVTSSATGTATASVSGTTVTITPKAVTSDGQTATITVTSAATGKYLATSATYTITVNRGTLTITPSPYKAVYDGNAHSASIKSSVANTTISYGTSQTALTNTVTVGTSNTVMSAVTRTAGGTTSVYYKASKTGYKDVTGSTVIAISRVVLSASSGTTIYPNAKTITINTNSSGGTLSAASSDTSIATVSVDGTTVTIMPKAVTSDGQTATITVTSAATGNYVVAKATYTITINRGTLTIAPSPYNGQYDASAHSASIKSSAANTTIMYGTTQTSLSNTMTVGTSNEAMSEVSRTSAGTTTVYFKASKSGYQDVTGSTTIKITRYSITYDPNGGTYNGSAGITAKAMTYGATANNTPGVAARAGYQFKGWYTAASGGTQVFNASGQCVSGDYFTATGSAGAWKGNANLTVYAQWSAYVMTLKFHVNGGSIESGYIYNNTTYYRAGSDSLVERSTDNSTWADAMASINTATTYYDLNNVGTFGIKKTGYHVTSISAYNTKADGRGVDVSQQNSTTDSANAVTIARLNNDAELTANVTKTLYVNWVINTYSVSYNANGGTGTMTNSSHTYGTAKNLTANAYTRTGYSFIGWNTKADGTGTGYANRASVKNLTASNGATVTLYAQWHKDEEYSLMSKTEARNIKVVQFTSTSEGKYDFTYQIADSEWFRILDLPKGVKYTITEQGAPQYRAKYVRSKANEQ